MGGGGRGSGTADDGAFLELSLSEPTGVPVCHQAAHGLTDGVGESPGLLRPPVTDQVEQPRLVVVYRAVTAANIHLRLNT